MSEGAPTSNASEAAKPSSRRGPSTDGSHPAPRLDLSDSTAKQSMDRRTVEEVFSPIVPTTPNPFGQRPGSLDLDDYFVSSCAVRTCGLCGV